MSFVSALPAQRPLFSISYPWKSSSDAGSGVETITYREVSLRDVSLTYDIVPLLGKGARDVGVGLELIMKVLSDIGIGLDRVSLQKIYEEVFGIKVPFVKDWQIIEPEDHNLQVEALKKLKSLLEEWNLL